MNKYVLCFDLEQITPLIHFQPKEVNPTLRVTEVKPKLDRFIIEKIGKGAYVSVRKSVRKEYKDWFIKKDDEVYALDYKMQIVPNGAVSVNEIEGYFGFDAKGKVIQSPMFFANMSNSQNEDFFVKKEFSFCPKLKLFILLSDEKLKEKIEDSLGEFFLLTNFGMRQSKGYGSFIIPQKGDLKLSFPYFTVNVADDKKAEEAALNEDEKMKRRMKRLFDSMELFYRAIRSGINDPFGERFYMKSFMFAYAKYVAKKHWEKRTIKSELYNKLPRLNNGGDLLNEAERERYRQNDVVTYCTGKHDRYLFKDYLGLSTIERWKKPSLGKDGNEIVYKGYFTLKKSNGNIARMKSPITLKPVKLNDNEYRVYVIYREIPEGFKDKSFKVSADFANDAVLSLRTYPKFSMENYMDFVLQEFPQVDNLILYGKKTRKAKRIVAMYNELRKTYKPMK